MIWKRGKDRLVMDSLSHRVTINGREIALTAAEWKILAYLGTSPGMVVSRDRILGECLDYMAEGSERTVDTHIKNVRSSSARPISSKRSGGSGYASRREGMKRLFRTRLFGLILSSFLLSLLLFIAAMSASFFLGYRRSAAGWGREKLGSVEAELRETLAGLLARYETGPGSPAGRPEGLARLIAEIVPPGVPIEVYDADMRPLYAGGHPHMMGGRGMMHGAGRMGAGYGRLGVPRGTPGSNAQATGAARSQADRRPLQRLERDGRLVGYYRIGVPGFGFDSANARFLSSMRTTIWAGAAFALPSAFLLALILSRRLSLAARKVAGGIQEMARGDLA